MKFLRGSKNEEGPLLCGNVDVHTDSNLWRSVLHGLSPTSQLSFYQCLNMEMKPLANGDGGVSEQANKAPKKIGPYDVLLEEDVDTNTLRLLGCPHVGNNRLEVLLLMNRNEYEESVTAGMDTSPVLNKLVDIVTQQCIPPGRFLVSDRPRATDAAAAKAPPSSDYQNYVWEEISLVRARQFLETALLDANTAGLAGFPTNPATTGGNAANTKPPPASSSKDTAAENKKRFRRSSLLRRSVSESFVRKVQAENGGNGRGGFRASEFGKKKNPNRRHSSFLGGRKPKAPPKVNQAGNLDILFNFEQTALLPNHVGNNRLHVLLNIHKEKYQQSDEKEQNSSLQEWVRTVTQFWGGRFLRQEEEDSSTYEVLDAAQAELALHSVLSELSTSAGDDLVSITSSASKKKPMAVDSVAAPTMDVHHMRNAAVQSLQKRKKRQGLASRLRRLATNTLTRSNRPAPDANNASQQQAFPKHSSLPGFTRDSSSMPEFNRETNSVPEFGRDSSIPGFSAGDNNSVPVFTRDPNSGITSLPTSPTPIANSDAAAGAQSQRSRRSLSITLPRFMTGRASLRRNQNLAADGVGRDLRASIEADEREFGPEAFGEVADEEQI